VIAAPFDSPGDKSTRLIESPSVRGDDGAPAAYGRQLARVAEAIEARTPYPPGMSDDFDWATYRPDGEAAGEMSGSIQMLIEYRAGCLWQRTWLHAVERNDHSAQHEALLILRQIPDWPGIRGDRGTGCQHAEQIAASATAGDRRAVVANINLNCRGA